MRKFLVCPSSLGYFSRFFTWGDFSRPWIELWIDNPYSPTRDQGKGRKKRFVGEEYIFHGKAFFFVYLS